MRGPQTPEEESLLYSITDTHWKRVPRYKITLFLHSPLLQLQYIIVLTVAGLFPKKKKKNMAEQKETFKSPNSLPTKHCAHNNGLQNWNWGAKGSPSFISNCPFCHSVCNYHLYQVIHFSSSRSTCKIGKHHAKKILCGSLRKII